PAPDDMILVPMGLMKYPYYKTILPCIIGKTILTAITCWLGMQVGLNQDFLVEVADYFSWGDIIYLVVPSETVNPRADLISFSSIFIFIWLVLKINFEGIMKRTSSERKNFERMLIKGGNFTFEEWVEAFSVINQEQFLIFLNALVEKLDVLSQKDNKYHIEPVISKKQAYKQSLEFVEFFFKETGEKSE
ncbi:MAG: hypothetical protein ACTSYU_14135, partial [Promethearchaeota archaeon]